MCFYDQHIYTCGDFKWSHFRQQCPQEHRIGQTCRLKLVMNTIYIDKKCAVCKKIETKARRFWIEEGRIILWETTNPLSRRASIQAAKSRLRDLGGAIVTLQKQRAYPFSRFNCETGQDSSEERKPANTLPKIKNFASDIATHAEAINKADSPRLESIHMTDKIRRLDVLLSYIKTSYRIPGWTTFLDRDHGLQQDVLMPLKLFFAACTMFTSPDDNICIPRELLSPDDSPDPIIAFSAISSTSSATSYMPAYQQFSRKELLRLKPGFPRWWRR
jgi:hypothetical protein